MKALVTGFEPFGGERVNPSMEAVRRLPRRLGAIELAVRILPTVFGLARARLEAALDEFDPDLVLLVGEAGGRAELSVERVAINLEDARIADNAGVQPTGRPVVAEGPAAYFATLPVKPAAAALARAGLPAAVSNSAGTFVCNHVFYALLHRAAARPPRLGAGLLHVPYLPAQAAAHPGAPSMALPDILRAIEIVLRVAAGEEASGSEAQLRA